MDALTTDYLLRAAAWLCGSTLLYFVMNGAGIFETAVLAPQWTRRPPESLAMFRKPYGLDLKTFWISMHSVHELSFMAAIYFCWQIEAVRMPLLLLFSAHFAVRVWTIAYFAPAVMRFEALANSGESVENLVRKAARWRQWNYVRMTLFLLISLALLPLCLQVLQAALR